MTAAIGSWINRALCEADGSPSTKRMLFALVIVYALGICSAQFAVHRGLDPQLVDLVKACIYATAAAYTGGRFAESREPELIDTVGSSSGRS